MTKRDELIALADEFDEIEVDTNGKCDWTAVANAQTHLRRRILSALEAPAAGDGEPVAWQVVDAAKDIVALWDSPKIQGLPRAERNSAIEDSRAALIDAVHKLARSSVGSEQGSSNSKVAGSNPAAPANNATEAHPVEQLFCKQSVAGSNPARGTITAPPADAGMREALADIQTWCDNQGALLGAVDGYDYRSGQEAAYRHVSIEIGKRMDAALTAPGATTKSDGDEPSSRTAGGFPVAAAPYHAEETGVIQPTRERAGIERGMDQGVTGGESATTNSSPSEPKNYFFETEEEAADAAFGEMDNRGLFKDVSDDLFDEIKTDVATAAITAYLAHAGKEGWVMVPKEPTEAMWGGLARDLIAWDRGLPNQYGSTLHKHLRARGREIPDWLLAEIPDINHTPPKGTVAVCIYRAMLAAAQNGGE